MEFSGEFDLEGVTSEEAWIMLSDPVAIRKSLRGCRYITPMDDDFNFDEFEPEPDLATLPEADPDVVADRAFEQGQTYAALMQVGVGSVKPRFESRITIEEREFPRMLATGTGNASNSRFEMESWMEVGETDDGARIEWGAEADVAGRLAQLGGRVIDPVATKIVNDFFGTIEAEMRDVDESEEGSSVTDRLRNLI